MIEVAPTKQLFESTHGIEFPRRADRAKGVSFQEARGLAQRWRDRTDDIDVYLQDVAVPQAKMYLDAGLGKPVFFRNDDGNEQARFPGTSTSPFNLRDHPRYANQAEDYDGLLDAVTSGSSTVAQMVSDGAQRFQIRRAGKMDDIDLLPPAEIIKHPRNGQLARRIRQRLKPAAGSG